MSASSPSQTHFNICRGGSSAKLQVFLVASTCLLYLVAAGLFSRAIWLFEQQQWNKVVGGDAAELGDGPGSYDIDRSIWHVNVSEKSCLVICTDVCSAVTLSSTVEEAGPSSTLSWAGTTRPRTVLFLRTTCTGSLLLDSSLP